MFCISKQFWIVLISQFDFALDTFQFSMKLTYFLHHSLSNYEQKMLEIGATTCIYRWDDHRRTWSYSTIKSLWNWSNELVAFLCWPKKKKVNCIDRACNFASIQFICDSVDQCIVQILLMNFVSNACWCSILNGFNQCLDDVFQRQLIISVVFVRNHLVRLKSFDVWIVLKFN